ncbi:MAG: stringent starvation protein B [Oceanococcus sp.]
MISRKPFLLRAMIEWCEANGLTPLLAVDAEQKGVQVPRDFVEDGRITLNVSFSAMQHRDVSNESVTGQARFAGRSAVLSVPMAAIEALIVRETGEGMVFPDDEADSETAVAQHLKDELRAVTGISGEQEKPQQGLHLVDSAVDNDDGDDQPPPPPPRGRPTLKVVK